MNHTDESHAVPCQPDGIGDDTTDLPDPARAAERVRAYVREVGDGLYDVVAGVPLYGRDLEVLCRAVDKVDNARRALELVLAAANVEIQRLTNAQGWINPTSPEGAVIRAGRAYRAHVNDASASELNQLLQDIVSAVDALPAVNEQAADIEGTGTRG